LRAPNTVQLDHCRRPKLKSWQIPNLTLSDLVNVVHSLTAAGTDDPLVPPFGAPTASASLLFHQPPEAIPGTLASPAVSSSLRLATQQCSETDESTDYLFNQWVVEFSLGA
jgi:hypothetical protein